MKRKMSAKVKWAVGLLIVMCISNFIYTIANSGAALAVSALPEYLPIIAVIVLTFYDHTYAAPKYGNFSLLRVWSLVLVWVQPFLSIFSYALAGLFNQVVGYWIGSCIFPAVAFTLLYLDGKNTVAQTAEINTDAETENLKETNIRQQEIYSSSVKNEKQEMQNEHIDEAEKGFRSFVIYATIAIIAVLILAFILSQIVN